METLSFILGISAVLVIVGVVVLVKTVVEVNRLRVFAANLESAIANSIEKQINENDVNVHVRIDREIDRVNIMFSESIKHTDSRVDKLESKTSLTLDERLRSLEEYFESKFKVKKEKENQLLKG
jgi:regulatory protein YycI of two-component signal transduction system YycFG